MVKKVAKNFDVKGKLLAYEPFGTGHINDTYRLAYRESDCTQKYILQKVNTSIFPNIEGLMNNIMSVTKFFENKYAAKGETRKFYRIVPTVDGKSYYKDENGGCWRMSYYIDNADTYEYAVDNDIFEKTGKAFGEFINALDDFPVDTLVEIIPNFHNTVDRFKRFVSAVKNNAVRRKRSCKKEIQFVYDHKDLAGIIVDKLNDGSIPTRVTHNDTKINNVLMDRCTGDAVCVIDLDTIMPGSLLYDFGDAVRSGCNTTFEDEQNLQAVDFDMEKFEYFTRGFIAGIGDKMTEVEKEFLPISCVILTYECGMRFLTDYLNGDTYFKTEYPTHNLVRCRTQFKLVGIMLDRLQEMKDIVAKY